MPKKKEPKWATPLLKMSTVLRLAREYIESGKKRYLCESINAVYRDNVEQIESYFVRSLLMEYTGRLTDWIDDMLTEEHAYLEGWLITNCKEYRVMWTGRWDDMPTEERADVFAKLKTTRLAWIDWMIAELEKEYQ
jgi:hypothetical protein